MLVCVGHTLSSQKNLMGTNVFPYMGVEQTNILKRQRGWCWPYLSFPIVVFFL